MSRQTEVGPTGPSDPAHTVRPSTDPFLFLTVDVEEYYDAEAFSGVIARSEREKYPPHVENNTMELLRLFHEFGARGTFFVLGNVARKHPGLIRSILESGHEVGSHGDEHRMITKMSPAEFREDVRKSRRVLEDISGAAILGYRAPTFSIVKSTEWAHEILRDEGYRYSSSVFPIRHDRYGWPEFGIHPRKMAIRGDRWIWEIPLSVERMGGFHVPFGGGGYLRLYPLFLTEYFLRRLIRKGRPAVVYVHPWEIDRQHPRIAMPVLRRTRHYAGISGAEEKIRELLRTYRFGRMDDFLQQASGCPGPGDG